MPAHKVLLPFLLSSVILAKNVLPSIFTE